jgi:hypothetical protein
VSELRSNKMRVTRCLTAYGTPSQDPSPMMMITVRHHGERERYEYGICSRGIPCPEHLHQRKCLVLAAIFHRYSTKRSPNTVI